MLFEVLYRKYFYACVRGVQRRFKRLTLLAHATPQATPHATPHNPRAWTSQSFLFAVINSLGTKGTSVIACIVRACVCGKVRKNNVRTCVVETPWCAFATVCIVHEVLVLRRCCIADMWQP
eukprot:m.166013 g.166013  ORF g.166013 m.166013 type:complete len:121 (-) comp17747_c1_seq6:62-424(-)